jgi:hypothetical protein
MAQAISKKNVRKNCVDVEQVVNGLLSESEREAILINVEPVKSIKFNKEVLKFTSNYNVNYYKELIPINQIRQNLVYRNYGLY